MTDTVEVLKQARAILTEETWGRDKLFCEDGRVCALGAVYTALGARYDEKNEVILFPSGKSLLRYPDRTRFKSDESYARAVRRYDNAAEAFEQAFHPAERALDSAARDLHNRGIVSFNDAQATGVTQVKAVFTAAIKNEKKKETVSV